ADALQKPEGERETGDQRQRRGDQIEPGNGELETGVGGHERREADTDAVGVDRPAYGGAIAHRLAGFENLVDITHGAHPGGGLAARPRLVIWPELALEDRCHTRARLGEFGAEA